MHTFFRTVRQLRIAAALLMLWTAAVCIPGQCADSVPVEYAWQRSPELDFSWWHTPRPPLLRAKPESLLTQSADERLRAAQALVRLADQATPTREALLTALMTRLEQGETVPYVRAELVAAVCELDDGSQAARLWKIVRDDPVSRPTFEQACIGWRVPLVGDVWRSRLIAESVHDQDLLRALKGIGAVGTQHDIQALTDIVNDATRASALRLVAARVIGELTTSDQVTLAKQLRVSSAEHADLLAVLVIGEVATQASQEFIIDIADHGSGLAQRHAYQWLCKLDTETALAKMAQFAQHTDSELRRLSLHQAAGADSQDALTILSAALNDPQPALRNAAREFLLARTTRSADHLTSVKEMVASHIAEEEWRSLQQCLRLVVDLQLTEHVPRMLELLDHQRPEVCITAAWALRHLAKEESALQAMLEHVQRVTDRLDTPTADTVLVEEFELRRVAHLMEALGLRRYRPAGQTLMRYVPKRPEMGEITRMAGLWACGKMWEGEENADLAKQLCKCIADTQSLVPELESIRFCAMLALGWLADPKTVDDIKTHGEGKPTAIGYASEWALQRISR